MEERHISSFSGKTIGIDGYCWLHKSLYAGNKDIVLNDKSYSYIYYLKNKVKLLVNAGIIPILIFDGNKIPIKGKEEIIREYKRSELRNKGIDMLEYDKNKAMDILIQSIDVTPEMVHRFVLLLNEMGIEYIVARKLFLI